VQRSQFLASAPLAWALGSCGGQGKPPAGGLPSTATGQADDPQPGFGVAAGSKTVQTGPAYGDIVECPVPFTLSVHHGSRKGLTVS
jgi:hypothetical protein